VRRRKALFELGLGEGDRLRDERADIGLLRRRRILSFVVFGRRAGLDAVLGTRAEVWQQVEEGG
jgi:hypothetical protein